VYPYTITTYSYGKTLLAPGMRIGYLTVPPTMPDRELFRQRVLLAQIAQGYAFPNALLQHALADLEKLSIDVPALQRRRDRLVPALRELGYETTFPEGTFYVMARARSTTTSRSRSCWPRRACSCCPGQIVEVPGWFRISLTATDEMVERGLAGFSRARERALSAVPAG
jgi:aspartate aminotransferase